MHGCAFADAFEPHDTLSEDVWGEDMDVEDETESRKKLDDKRKKLQKESRDVEKLSLISKEAQETTKESLQHQLQEVEKRRHDLLPEHQKAQKRSQKYTVFRIRENIAERKCSSAREDAKGQTGDQSQ